MLFIRIITHLEPLCPEILAGGEDADVRLDAAQHHRVHPPLVHLLQLLPYLRDQHGELGLGEGSHMMSAFPKVN